MYYLSPGKVWGIRDAALKPSAEQQVGEAEWRPHQPATPACSLPLSPPSLLRWQRIWQKPSEAGTWYCFSVPPPFYAFLIFKAIIGLSDKILSNQILSSNLVLCFPLAGKVGGGSTG